MHQGRSWENCCVSEGTRFCFVEEIGCASYNERVTVG
jgi:hypothetical protein